MIKRRGLLKWPFVFGLGAVFPLAIEKTIGSGRTSNFGLAGKWSIEPTREPVRTTTTSDSSPFGFAAPPIGKVRIGIIGLGARGTILGRILASIDNAEIIAVCDLRESQMTNFDEVLARKQGLAISYERFHGSEDTYKDLLELDLDLIIVATPWHEHAHIVVDAMQAGKHVAVELHAGITTDECLKILDVARETKRHCMLLENCCYGETEQAVYNMCRHGVLGEIVHAQAAYIHDLIDSTFDPDRHWPQFWRMKHHQERNGCLYASHGLGPISKSLGILETDMMTELMSVSGPSVGYNQAAQGKFEPFKQGDMNLTLIRTAQGKIIQLQFNTSNPRPYSRDHTLVGTRGTFTGWPDRLAILPDATNFNPEAWDAALREYRSQLWIDKQSSAQESGTYGHGGKDYMMLANLIDNLVHGRPMDIDVVESVLWSLIGPLSEESVANGGTWVKIPDVSDGAWIERGEAPAPHRWAPQR